MRVHELFETMEENATVLDRVLMDVNIADQLRERNLVLERVVDTITRIVDEYREIQETNSTLTRFSRGGLA